MRNSTGLAERLGPVLPRAAERLLPRHRRRRPRMRRRDPQICRRRGDPHLGGEPASIDDGERSPAPSSCATSSPARKPTISSASTPCRRSAPPPLRRDRRRRNRRRAARDRLCRRHAERRRPPARRRQGARPRRAGFGRAAGQAPLAGRSQAKLPMLSVRGRAAPLAIAALSRTGDGLNALQRAAQDALGQEDDEQHQQQRRRSGCPSRPPWCRSRCAAPRPAGW